MSDFQKICCRLISRETSLQAEATFSLGELTFFHTTAHTAQNVASAGKVKGNKLLQGNTWRKRIPTLKKKIFYCV